VLSEKTVRNHVGRTYAKIGVTNGWARASTPSSMVW
jgi:DNA-binding NarL/FixJ family response regulator